MDIHEVASSLMFLFFPHSVFRPRAVEKTNEAVQLPCSIIFVGKGDLFINSLTSSEMILFFTRRQTQIPSMVPNPCPLRAVNRPPRRRVHLNLEGAIPTSGALAMGRSRLVRRLLGHPLMQANKRSKVSWMLLASACMVMQISSRLAVAPCEREGGSGRPGENSL